MKSRIKSAQPSSKSQKSLIKQQVKQQQLVENAQFAQLKAKIEKLELQVNILYEEKLLVQKELREQILENKKYRRDVQVLENDKKILLLELDKNRHSINILQNGFESLQKSDRNLNLTLERSPSPKMQRKSQIQKYTVQKNTKKIKE
ncbi:Hypothetical_protein [Hexamita inflata]|uniref:Hypothetical_protein n=1 Tax=Hexamita inflata TaxID=28002 RepID=A0AA86TGI2_9EUKA|nr:Hypothetical protein HINF_LOCUS4545 [Hexamita inflata]CAI9921064.1 Hypothetical protein HINF_LOCUS8709 [Hexamita inflata]